MKAKGKLLVGILAAGIILSSIAGVSFAATKGGKTNTAQGFIASCQEVFNSTTNDLSNLLGLKPDQITEKQRNGESLADIAKSKGVSEDEVVSTIIEPRKRMMDERVKSGFITQEQAKFMLDRMKARIGTGIKTPGVGLGYGMGSGMMGSGARGCAGPQGNNSVSF